MAVKLVTTCCICAVILVELSTALLITPLPRSHEEYMDRMKELLRSQPQQLFEPEIEQDLIGDRTANLLRYARQGA
ncbi:unnamed protein product [Gongylonema pulchrum]|uniref:Uncharacterized protein n=1 Tax=Gongylonema pulchrum TaxID=637853 RepID=A0A183D9M0_9BILA|nr:unnamed protein product [Gongylonema pulchrum]